jgi:phosphoglycolate phosphatase
MGRIKAVIFDMDGTLVNSLQDLADSANAAVAEQGFPVHSMEEVRQFVGDGVRMLIKRSLPATVSDAVVDSCLSRFREIYEVNKLNHTGPYEGMLPLLDSLRAKGILTGVLSNKYDLAVKQIAPVFFLASWIWRWVKVQVFPASLILPDLSSLCTHWAYPHLKLSMWEIRT